MAVLVVAQNSGDTVEYKAERFPEKWEVGTVVRPLPGGTQVLIREKPTQFFPEGFERAYSLADIRAVGQQPPVPKAAPAPAAAAARPTAPAASPAAGAAGGPMTQPEVIAFLRARLGDGDPFASNPAREQALQQLRQEVLRRGVSFRYAAIGTFSNELGKFGALSNVTAPLAQNFGPPGTAAALMGKWLLLKVGATTTVSRGGQLYQRQEFAGNADALIINADGSYLWGSIKGRWRRATAEELAKSDKGGEGVVLLRGKSGADWLAFHRDEGGPEGRGIKITDLETRNLRERGTR
jgi:hypothetical protein